MLTIGYTLLPLASIVLILHLLRGPGVLPVVARWRPAVALGRISYGVYLWHYVLWGMLRRTVVPADTSEWVRTPVFLALAIGVAAGSYRWVEQPFLARKRRHVTPTPEHAAGDDIPVSGWAGPPAAEAIDLTDRDEVVSGSRR